MASVSGGLFQEVREDPAEVDHRFSADVVARLVERRGICDCVHLRPGSSIRSNDVVRGFVVERIRGHGDVVPCESLGDPQQLGSGQMLDEPQETRSARHEHTPNVVFSKTVELSNNRLAVVLGERTENAALVGAREPRRLQVCHVAIVISCPKSPVQGRTSLAATVKSLPSNTIAVIALSVPAAWRSPTTQ